MGRQGRAPREVSWASSAPRGRALSLQSPGRIWGDAGTRRWEQHGLEMLRRDNPRCCGAGARGGSPLLCRGLFGVLHAQTHLSHGRVPVAWLGKPLRAGFALSTSCSHAASILSPGEEQSGVPRAAPAP